MSILSIIFFAGIVLCIIGLLHFVVYKTLVSIFALSALSHLATVRSIFIFLTVSFLAATLLSSKFDNIFTRILYSFSAYWMGLLFFLFIASCVYGITLGLVMIFHGDVAWVFLFGKILLAFAVVVSAYGAFHANDVQVTRYDVTMPNLPDAWKGKKAVLVADLHLGQVRGANFASKVTGMINTEQPDIVFIAGDLFDGVKVDDKNIVMPLAGIKAPWGTYFAPGNHEEIHGTPSNYFEAIKGAGITVLKDEKKNVEGVDIVGLDYETTESAEAFASVLQKVGIDKSTPSILIKHVPIHLEVAEQAGIDLEVSGHTHRAQLWPLSYITRKIFKGYDYGMKAFGGMEQITTSGIGTWGPPYRVGTKSEMVVITFK